MKKLLLLLFITLAATVSRAQNKIEWDGKYRLQFSDFTSPGSQIGDTKIVSLSTAPSIDFSFRMSTAVFLFTKNFNKKVNCTFDRNAASIIAPDSLTAKRLLDFARYQFDLSELYARKFRKKLYKKKKLTSDVNFFKPVYDEINREMTTRNAQAQKETRMGMDSLKLQQLHDDVLKEIQELSDYCKTCKPKKHKKK